MSSKMSLTQGKKTYKIWKKGKIRPGIRCAGYRRANRKSFRKLLLSIIANMGVTEEDYRHCVAGQEYDIR